jgi:enamidase
MARTLITNIGEAFTGDIATPTRDLSRVLIDGDRIAALDPPPGEPSDMVIDAKGGALLPGIVDGHVHPVFGEWTPTQNTQGWIRNYLHGGTTTMVSAGELHVPGLDYNNLTADLMTNLALVTRATTGRQRWSGVKLHAGTVLMVPGMQAAHFDQLAEAGSILAKFLFYPLEESNKAEARQYVAWCHERGIRVKVHTGGVSRSGANAVCGFNTLSWLQPDVAAHVSGGPIPMSDADLDALVDETDFALELCSSGSYRSFIRVVERLAIAGRLDRLTLGTDTPGGTGVLARGMLRNILFLASVCGLSAGQAIAVGTGNTAVAHGLDVGFLREGAPADLVIAGRIDGSAGTTVAEAIEHGDLPGISTVMIDGQTLVKGRSEQTPPPAVRAEVTVEDWNAFGGCPFCG